MRRDLARWLLLSLAAATAWAQDAPPAVAAGRVSIRDCGAVGDGLADDSAALATAFGQVAAAGQGTVYLPPGTYRLAARVDVAMTGSGVAVIGDGQGVSCLRVDNPDGGLRLTDPLCRTQVTLRDFSVYAARPAAGVGLAVESPRRGVRNYRTLLVQNVDLRGEGLPTRAYFNAGLVSLWQWRPLFTNVIVSGVLDPALRRDAGWNDDDSPQYAPEVGIRADGCYAPVFENCYVWSTHTGYTIRTEGQPEGPEDGSFRRCFAVGCRIGIDITTPIAEPQLVVDACHLNCRDVGLRLENRKFFQITDCLFYGLDGDPARPYLDIELRGLCWGGVIRGNQFHSPDPDNLKPPAGGTRTMIAIDEQCRDILIDGNLFHAKGNVLRAAAGGRGILSSGNRITNPQTIAPEGFR
jgi:hypothetical protein